ncbi:cell division control protein 45 [Cryptococcus neoformans Tu401-1]|nr:cell division control protein 45 [Cryptococcus neoformans var. grubii Tu401-1]
MPVVQPPADDLRPSDLTYTHAYNSIVSRVRRTAGAASGGVVILTGVDVDGLLGARILCSLFKNDDIPYRLIPVGGLTELEEKSDEALASEEIHTLILVSLGSLLTLTDFFNLPKKVHLHVIDSHRPWNLGNLFDIDLDDEDDEDAHGKIWIWGDGDEFSENMDQLRKSFEALQFLQQKDSDEDSYSDEESEAEEEEPEEEDEEGGDDVEDEEGGPRKRRREDSVPARRKRLRDNDRPRKLPKAIKEAHQERIAKYYNHGTYYGQSVALTIYLLATVLERADNDILWYSILGVTHQYITSHIDRERYEEYHTIFLDEVVRLNHEPDPGALQTPNPDNRNISKSEELRFMLFRHWDLYNAMLHSGYVAGRLGIWKEKGRSKLRGLLAKMGYSIQQCNQAWSHMDMELKRQLPEVLERVGPEYGLVELSYPSFTRAYGFQLSSLSAADAVEVISSLLDIAVGVRLEVDREGGKGGGEWFGGTTRWSVGTREAEMGIIASEPGERAEGTEGEESEEKKDQDWHVTNFWIAYDACDDVPLLRRSLPLAMALHRAIIRAGSDLLDKSIIRTLRNFRLTILSEGPDLRLFCHPSPLSRLALWLVDATRDRWVEKLARQNAHSGGKVKSLPFVVACLNEEKGTFSVVGVTGAPEFGDVRKNKFGLAFQRAASFSNATASLDMFDTSVVEVGREDLQSFIEHLHLHSV